MPEFPKYGPQLEELILCGNPNKSCWLRTCAKCPNTVKTLAGIMRRSGQSKNNLTICTQWSKNSETQRFQKYAQEGTLDKLLDHFNKILPEFLKHSYIKRSQSTSFQKDNEEVKQAKG